MEKNKNTVIITFILFSCLLYSISSICYYESAYYLSFAFLVLAVFLSYAVYDMLKIDPTPPTAWWDDVHVMD